MGMSPDLPDPSDTARSPFVQSSSAIPAAPSPAVRRAGPPSRPSAFAAINFDDLRRKGWAIALTLASAYVATRPEKYGWLAPVLTAAAAGSKPPTVKPTAAVAAVLAVMALTLGWRAWAA